MMIKFFFLWQRAQADIMMRLQIKSYIHRRNIMSLKHIILCLSIT